MFRVKNNSTGQYLDQGHLQYYFLKSDGVLWKQMYRNGIAWMEPVKEKYTAEKLMINHHRGVAVMPLYENTVVYVAGHGVCVVKYNHNECMWVLEDVNTGEEYLYRDIMEDIEKIMEPSEPEDV